MRTLTSLSLLLVPAALVAQAPAPAPQNLTDTYNTEVKAISALISEMKPAEAIAKAKAMIPAQEPVIETAKLAAGIEDGRAYSMMHNVLANALGLSGDWEKSREVQEKRVVYTKKLQADVLKTIQPIEEQWKKAVENAKAYIAKNEPRKAVLESKLNAVRAEFAEVNSGKKKLTKEQTADLQARGKEAQQDEVELNSINQSLPMEKENLQKEQKVRGILETLKKDVEAIVTSAQEGLAKIDKTIGAQAEEIKKFNDEQNEKARKAAGKKAPKTVITGNDEWVKAVLNGKSLTEMTKAQDQFALLSRLHVLSPTNNKVVEAIDNLQAGREIFYKPKKAAGKSAKPAKTNVR